MRRLTAAACLLAALLALAGCNRRQQGTDGAGGEYRFTVLHFNDTQGRLRSYYRMINGETRLTGGMARMAHLVNTVREENRRRGADTFLFIAGDVLTGSAVSNVYKGEADFEILNIVRPDAFVIGNHEFDHGWKHLQRLAEMSRFPLLGANIYRADGTRFAKPAIRHTARLPGGGQIVLTVVGLVTPTTPVVTHPDNVAGLVFRDPAEEFGRVIDELGGRGDIVVALTHLGIQEDRDLASRTTGLDVIVGGHSQTLMSEPERVNGVLITQAYEEEVLLGRLDFVYRPGTGLTMERFAFLPIDESLPEDPVVREVVERYSLAIEKKLDQVIAVSAVDLDGARDRLRTRETNLGNLVADTIREAAGAQAAFINGGGIRAGIPAGNITLGDTIGVLPFPNRVVRARLSGRLLREVVSASIGRMLESRGKEMYGGFLQVSGMRIEYGREGIRRFLVGGRPLDDGAEYLIGTNDFLLAGGDGYSMLKDVRGEETGVMVQAAFLEHLKRIQKVTAASIPMGRIVEIAGH